MLEKDQNYVVGFVVGFSQGLLFLDFNSKIELGDQLKKFRTF